MSDNDPTPGRVCSHIVATNLRCDVCSEFLGVPSWTETRHDALTGIRLIGSTYGVAE